MAKPQHEDIDYPFLEPDIDNLEKEWVNQPRLMFEYALELEEARFDVSETKATVDLVYAELEAAIREDPDEFELTKVTDAAVKSCITAQASYQNAVKARNKAIYRAGVLSAVVNALEHRKRALEKLVDLYGMNYFSKPSNKGGRDVADDIVRTNAVKKVKQFRDKKRKNK